MFRKLRDKWGVGPVRLLLILCTFSIGGSLSGYAGRKLLQLMQVEQGVIWIIAYVLLVTILWPLAVLLISIPLGQFNFFRKYLSRLGKKLFSRKSTTNNSSSNSGSRRHLSIAP